MKKIALSLLLILLSTNISYSIELEDVKMPLPIEYRLGTNDDVEQVYQVIDSELNNTAALLQKEKEAVKKVTYADLSLNNISKDITSELKIEQRDITEDLKILWMGAAGKSESIRFAIYKLSNPDEDKPSGNALKKVIRPLASMTALAGLGIPNPFIGTAAIMGSTLASSMGVTDKDLNYKYSKVTDADMVVLVRKIDDLQRNLSITYYDYLRKRDYLNQLNGIVEKRENLIDKNQNTSKEILQILDTFYKESVDERNKARTDFLYVRSTLEQLVGAECLLEFEKNLNERQ